MPRAGRSSKTPAKRKAALRIFNSMQEADAADREYWWSRTPAHRLREAERLRQLNYGYGQGKSLPRFQRTLRVADMCELD